MGPKFSITDDSVNKHSSNLDTSTQAMNAQAKAFITAIEPLQASWQGGSADAWASLTETWNSAIAQLNNALQEITGKVGNAGAVYDRYHQQQQEKLTQQQGQAAAFQMPKV